MEIVKIGDCFQVLDSCGYVEFEGTEDECEDYVSDNQEDFSDFDDEDF